MAFTGEFAHTIDAKQRLAIPVDFRSEMDPQTVGHFFYATAKLGGHISLWPSRTFEQLAGHFDSSFLVPEEVRRYMQTLFPAARKLELDGAGRIRFPEALLTKAGLGTSVMVLGMRDHVEVWDAEQWKTYSAELEAAQTEIELAARAAMKPPSPDGRKNAP